MSALTRTMQPPPCQQFRVPVDVAYDAARGSVQCCSSVVFDTYLEFLITHVDAPLVDHDLGPWPRQPSIDEDQSRSASPEVTRHRRPSVRLLRAVGASLGRRDAARISLPTGAGCKPVALANASTLTTAKCARVDARGRTPSGRRRQRTSRQPTAAHRRTARRGGSECPSPACRCGGTSSAGRLGSIHFAPCIAAADRPTSVDCLPDHSHAATARFAAVISQSFGTYTLR